MTKKFSFKKEYRGRSIFVIFNTLFFIIYLAAMLVPILKVVCDSFSQSVVYGIRFWPEPGKFTLEAYDHIITMEALRKPFINSVWATAVGTFLGLLMSTIGAYILIQKDMPGVKLIGWLFMFTMIFNGGLVPTYLVMRQLNLIDNTFAVILPLSLNVYNLVLMRSFFEQLPASLFEAAEIDGCSPMGIFIKIVLPLSKPALASIGLFFAVAYWSEYFHYVLYLVTESKYNFQVKLRSLVLDSESVPNIQCDPSTLRNAAIVVAMLPFAIIYPFCQKYFITGITLGAVKE